MSRPAETAKNASKKVKSPAMNASPTSSASAKKTAKEMGGAVKRAGKRISDAG